MQRKLLETLNHFINLSQLSFIADKIILLAVILVCSIRSLIDLSKNVENSSDEQEDAGPDSRCSAEKGDDRHEWVDHCEHNGFLEKKLFLGELVYFGALRYIEAACIRSQFDWNAWRRTRMLCNFYSLDQCTCRENSFPKWSTEDQWWMHLYVYKDVRRFVKIRNNSETKYSQKPIPML